MINIGLIRDTQRWAIKASYGEKDGVPFDIRKTPKGTTIESSKEKPPMFNAYRDLMIPLYEDGKFFKPNFIDVMERASK